MARIRQLSIRNFRGLKSFDWTPTPGINCLIGPGDSGKSSVLDAIDLCLGNRRNVQFTDADFSNLDISQVVSISITIGELGDELKNLDAYGMFLRGFDSVTGTIQDEPEKDAEAVLTLTLTVSSDLEPIWTLYSDRAADQNLARNLSQEDRARVAPTRIGAAAEHNLAWRRGSILNRLSENTPDASAALIKAARDSRGFWRRRSR